MNIFKKLNIQPDSVLPKLLSVALCIAAIFVWFTLGQIKSNIKSGLHETLLTIVQSTAETMHLWIEERQEDARTIARSTRLRDLISSLTKKNLSQKQFANAQETQEIRQFFKPFLVDHGYLGMFVISPNYISIASMRDANLGTMNFLADQKEILTKVFQGETLLTRPMVSDVSIKDITPMRDKEPTMFVCTPIFDSDQQNIIAALALRIDVGEFTKISQVGRFGKSGESYAFNGKGRLITESRFDEQLQEIGIILPGQRAILNLEIRDPEENYKIIQGKMFSQKKLPFTRMIGSILKKHPTIEQPIVLVDGYRDYRGVKVVGAGVWSDKFKFGITTELDFEEAFTTYQSISLVVMILFAFTLLIFTLLLLKIDSLRNLAMDANPLTKLPGNRFIAETVNAAIQKRLAWVVVYCDLDNFKAFNDKYGFSKGDQVLRFTGQVLSETIKSQGGANSFIGHIGGDDFIFMVPRELLQKASQNIINRFDQGILEFYNQEDRANGFIEAKDRQGNKQMFPIIAISMASVTLDQHKFKHFLEVSSHCAELKKKAKAVPGSNLAMDQRGHDDAYSG